MTTGPNNWRTTPNGRSICELAARRIEDAKTAVVRHCLDQIEQRSLSNAGRALDADALTNTCASLCQRHLNPGDLAVALKKPAHTRRLQRSRPQKRCQIRHLLARRPATTRAGCADSSLHRVIRPTDSAPRSTAGGIARKGSASWAAHGREAVRSWGAGRPWAYEGAVQRSPLPLSHSPASATSCTTQTGAPVLCIAA